MPKQLTFDVTCGDKKSLKIRLDKWSPSKVYARLPVIGNYFAVPFSMMISPDGQAGGTNITEALLMLFQTMEENSFNDFTKMLVEGCFAGQVNVAENIDTLFEDDPSALLELITMILEEHYSCFFKRGFGRLAGILGPVTQQAQVLTKS